MAYKPQRLTVAEGGTGAATLTNHGVLIGAATSAITATAAGTAGQVLRSGGASADPTYSTATYPATAGTSGKVLVSDGTNIVSSTPTFPNASATSGKIIKSDGTNWVASTETYAAPGTSGNVLTSDGTNWTSAAPAASAITVLSAAGSLTNAQIKALHGTPVTVISTPGSGKAIIVLQAIGKLVYGGTNAFVAGGAATVVCAYGTLNLGTTIMSNAALIATVNEVNFASGSLTGAAPYTTVSNAALTLYNPSATEISGNAANNNTIDYQIYYYIVNI